MKKFLALLLALVMVFALAACGESRAPRTTDPRRREHRPRHDRGDRSRREEPEAIDPNDIEDTIEADTYEIAFVTDVGQLQDKSFNEGTWNGVKTYAYQNDQTYKYYQPANGDEATDDDRYDAMSQAVANGGARSLSAPATSRRPPCAAPPSSSRTSTSSSSTATPSLRTPTIAGSPVLTNVAGVNFNEEQCGYLAGYAVVKDGFTQLGFSGGGGGTNAACCRYGYGFLQGASRGC